MNTKNKLSCLAVLMISAFLSGCASHVNQVQSGFLGDYSQLKTANNFENTKIYQASNFDRDTLAAIREIKIVPFEIWIQHPENNDGIRLNPQRLQELSRYFHQQLKQALQNDYQLVEKAGSETLIIQGAFSEVKLSEPELSVTDFIPVRLVLNAGNAAYLNVTNQQDVITEVSIEAEFLLGNTSQRVFAMTATKQVDSTIGQSNDEAFKAVIDVLDIWVKNFVNKLANIRQSTK